MVVLECRKLAEPLKECGDLPRAIELNAVPHFTAFQTAFRRLLGLGQFHSMLLRYAQACRGLPKRIDLPALDGTGLESDHACHDYVRRRAIRREWLSNRGLRCYSMANSANTSSTRSTARE